MRPSIALALLLAGCASAPRPETAAPSEGLLSFVLEISGME